MVDIATQRGFGRRTVAIALFVLIPLLFGVLALVFPGNGQNDPPPMSTLEASLTLLRPLPLKGASGDVATQPPSRGKHAEHGSR